MICILAILDNYGKTITSTRFKIIESFQSENAIPTYSPMPNPTASPLATPNKIQESNNANLSSKTITCIKGKLIKKITGINPKCPSGYKIK